MITIDAVERGWWYKPVICDGCGAVFHFVPHGLDSRIRGPAFGLEARRAGTCARDIAAFAAAHAACRPLTPAREEITASGLRIIDRRGR